MNCGRGGGATGGEAMRTAEERRRVRLAYGRGGLEIEVPADAEVLEPRLHPGLADEAAVLREAMRRPLSSPPLRELVPTGASVGVSVCDVTRPFPARRVLPVLLDELDAAGAGAITVFIATGTHRACSAAELEAMLGAEVLARVSVVQHDAFDETRHRDLGRVPGSTAPARLEAAFLDQAVRLTTGFIEPHFFAGFSGGPKMVAPGLAQLETVLELHSAARIGDPRASWGVTRGNPVHDAIREVAGRAGIAFNLDVTLNRDQAITAVFAGDPSASHAAGCEHALRTAMVQVREPYDVVVTTNSGYPLDQNLYQTIKGISAAAQIVRSRGVIVAASECSDGMPAHGRYGELLHGARGPADFLDRLSRAGTAVHDQWQVQVQAQIQLRARVLVHTAGVTPDDLRAAWLEPVEDVTECLRELAVEGRRIAVLPLGPQTIPYVGEAALTPGAPSAG